MPLNYPTMLWRQSKTAEMRNFMALAFQCFVKLPSKTSALWTPLQKVKSTPGLHYKSKLVLKMMGQ